MIPVLVRNVQMPAPKELPDSLKDLVYRNAALVRPAPDFDTDIKRLIRSLRRVLEASEAEAGEVRGEDAANLSGATASPEASDGLSVTKERPFVNSLGMRSNECALRRLGDAGERLPGFLRCDGEIVGEAEV